MSELSQAIEPLFRETAPDAEFVSLRLVHERSEALSVRRDIPQPVRTGDDAGVMVTVIDGGGLGYAGTSELTAQGLRAAGERAREWARRTARASVTRFCAPEDRAPRGRYETPVEQPFGSLALGARLDLLREQCARLKTDARILDWGAGLYRVEEDTLYLTADGGRVEQRFS